MHEGREYGRGGILGSSGRAWSNLRGAACYGGVCWLFGTRWNYFFFFCFYGEQISQNTRGVVEGLVKLPGCGGKGHM